MNIFNIIILLIVFQTVLSSTLQIDEVDDIVDGNLLHIGRNRLRTLTATPNTCTNKFGSFCTDCNTLWVCVGEDRPLVTQICANINPARPNCVNNRCTSDTDPDRNCYNSNIRCTDEGYFPNPTNCSQYYFCAGPLGASMLYECPNGFVYNPAGENCKRRLLVSDCNTVNCQLNTNKYVVYPGDQGYYTYCYNNNGIIEPIMFRCKDPINYRYNVATEQCEFRCRADGRIIDAADCQRYYECFRMGLNNYITLHQSCIRGFIFDDSLKQCVRGTCNPQITTNSPTIITTTINPITTTAATELGTV